MSRLGFGLEVIGLRALAAPKTVSAFCLLIILILVPIVTKIGFDGNIVGIVDENSTSYESYLSQQNEFSNLAKDLVVIVRADNIASAQSLEKLREYHLDLALIDGVENVISLFSLSDNGAVFPGDTAFPEEFNDDAHALSVIDNLLRQNPSARAFFALEKNAALFIVTPSLGDTNGESSIDQEIERLHVEILKSQPSGMTASATGLLLMRAAIVDAIISDQMILTIFGIILGSIVCFIVFRDVRSAVLCTLPALISVLGVLALFAATNTQLNFLTTVLPSLTMIVAFADAVVLYYRWQMLNNDETADRFENLKNAVRTVGPASALTSITTAVAFISFSYASSQSMTEFAIFGCLSVIIAFLSVIVILPLGCYWSDRLFARRKKKVRSGRANIGKFIQHLSSFRPVFVLPISLVLLVLLGIAHFQLDPAYKTMSVLPGDSVVRKTEQFANANFGGTSHIYAVLPLAEGSKYSDPKNRDLIQKVDHTLSKALPNSNIISLGKVWQSIGERDVSKVTKLIDETSPEVRGRIISHDGTSLLLTISSRSNQDTSQINDEISYMRGVLKESIGVSNVWFSGLPVLLAQEYPKLINQLRNGLIIAIVLAVGVVGFATGSIRMGIVSFVPNLMPLLITEAIILFSGSLLDMTNVVALTIAFGIAIDNAVHIINAYNNTKHIKADTETRLTVAMNEIGPALVASTSIVCVAALITQASSMPAIVTLGRLLIVTLCVALFTNLIMLPAFIKFLSRVKTEEVIS